MWWKQRGLRGSCKGEAGEAGLGEVVGGSEARERNLGLVLRQQELVLELLAHSGYFQSAQRHCLLLRVVLCPGHLDGLERGSSKRCGCLGHATLSLCLSLPFSKRRGFLILEQPTPQACTEGSVRESIAAGTSS